MSEPRPMTPSAGRRAQVTLLTSTFGFIFAVGAVALWVSFHLRDAAALVILIAAEVGLSVSALIALGVGLPRYRARVDEYYRQLPPLHTWADLDP